MTLAAPTAIILDETPLGLLTRKTGHAQGDACRAWLLALEAAGHRFFVPEAANTKQRPPGHVMNCAPNCCARVRPKASPGSTASTPPSRPVSCRSRPAVGAVLWARVRNSGGTTAPPEALAGDVLTAAPRDPALTRPRWPRPRTSRRSPNRAARRAFLRPRFGYTVLRTSQRRRFPTLLDRKAILMPIEE